MKVAVIGSGHVGATAAQRIAEANLADITLLDIVPGKAEALSLDLNSASSIMHYSRTITGTTDYQDISGADIVVLTAGQTRRPGQDREELLLNNAAIVKDACQKIAQYCPRAIVIVVTNPLDAMTYLTLRTTGFSADRVIGMGGVSDCARFNMLVADALNTQRQHIQSMIIGPHSDKMLILARLSTVQGTPLHKMLSQERIAEIIAETRSFGAKIVQLLAQGSAYFGPSAGIYALIEAIVNNRQNILCASTYLHGQYGLTDLCIGTPVKIGSSGIEEIIELELTSEEKELFVKSATQIKDLVRKIGV